MPLFRLWCDHTLGRYFTFSVQTSEDQPVITSGPFGIRVEEGALSEDLGGRYQAFAATRKRLIPFVR